MCSTKKRKTCQRLETTSWLARLSMWGMIALCLGGCAAALPPLPAATPPPLSLELTEQQQRRLAGAVYTVSPEDVLRIMVHEHPDLSLEVEVSPDGTLPYPFLGKVPAAGLSVSQLEAQMAQGLAQGYLVDPQLTITVVRYRNRHVYVLGAVRAPGLYPLQHNATLVEILSQAGGPTPEAGWYALVVRAANGHNGAPPSPASPPQQATVTHIDLQKLMVGQITQPVGLESGDTIYVPSAFFFVSGEVQRPGRYPLERHTTVHKALTLAGGFTNFAAKNSLRVKRLIDGQSREYQVRIDDFLQAEDVLVVPQSVF
jgi:polysaccharide export outer membrane protein